MLERCVPGTPLSRIGQEAALKVFAGLLPRLWVPAGEPFQTLASEAEGWAERLERNWNRAGRPFERSLLDVANSALRELGSTQGEQVLLNQDLHGDNVLRAEREPWLVIDPKPLVGEREFGVAPIVRAFEFEHTATGVLRRLDFLVEALGRDRERARLWLLAQSVAWSFDSQFMPNHIKTARWLMRAD